MMLVGPRAYIAASEERERKARDRPRGYGKPRPLQDLAEEVGTGHVVKHPAPGDFVALLARFPQISQDMVGMNVDCHARNKHRYA